MVAVVVTRDPGPWFDEVLAAWASQSYEELSVLFLDAGGEVDPTDRVGAVLPDAFVRRLPENAGFGPTVNQVLGMVEGAAFLLVCHDDCAPAPDAVHLLVEESYRSNAGVVSPKVVAWDDSSVLLHVGMNVDKTGAVVDRVHPGEVDHGQHDGVRDVFAAPGGCTLVRADLFAELGGFDPGIALMGEDLDLSWRAQVLGARVVVAPEARVRHVQALAGGIRASSVPGEPVTMQALQRRHELRAVLKCYSWFHLLRVVPQAALLALGEVVVALVAGDRARAAAVVGAWRQNLGSARELRRLRRDLRARRTVPDAEVRRLQLRGSARLSTYLSRLTHQGFEAAHGRPDGPLPEAVRGDADADAEPLLTGSVGAAFSEDDSFDELDDLGHRSGRDRFGRRRRQGILSTTRARLATWVVVAVVLVFGTRSLFGSGLPLIGQFVPLQSWTGTWHHFVSGWQPAGVGTTAPATPAFAVLGTVGTVLFGGMGLTQKVLVLACIPLGAWGVVRLMRPLASPRARLVAAVSYLGLPLAYDALARGRWDGLVAYAFVPWAILLLARSSGLRPFDDTARRGGWRATLAGQALVLGALEAVAVSFAPAIAVVVLVCAVTLIIGSLIMGERRGSLRTLAVGGGATVVAAVFCGPWVIGTLLAGRRSVGVFGLPVSSGSAPNWGELLRFATGPVGGSPLSWLLIAAALLPLLIGRRSRLGWSGRLWTVACGAWLLALGVAHGWMGSFAPSLDVLLVPAAVAVAAGVGLGVAAFESDLAGFSFGWRQVVTGLAVLAAVVGLGPVVAASFGGRWGVPSTGYGQALGYLSSASAAGPFRVLWLGDPGALPLGGWSIGPGFAYATSENGTPDAVDLWAPAGPGPADTLSRAVQLARAGETSHVGRLLAPAGVRYVVVLNNLAPNISGSQSATALPPPSDLVPALDAQTDLRVVPGEQGYTVFANTEYVPERAQRSHPAGGATSVGHAVPGSPFRWPSRADVTGWQPVLPGPPGAQAYQGPVRAGTVLGSYAPAGRWQLSTGGRAWPQTSAFGWAAQYRVRAAGTAQLRFGGTPLLPLGIVAEVVLWIAFVAVMLGHRRLSWRRARRGSAGQRPPSHAAPVDEPPPELVGSAGTDR